MTISTNAPAPTELQSANGQFHILIDSEIIIIQASSTGASPWTVLKRGAVGSDVRTHASGTNIYPYSVAPVPITPNVPASVVTASSLKMPWKVFAGGHSYLAGIMANPTTNRESAKLVRLMKGVSADETNVAVGGSALISQDGAAGPDATSGGWATIARSLASLFTARQTPAVPAPLPSPLQVALFCHGINDMALIGSTQFATSFPAALRYVIDLMRAGYVWTNDNVAFAYPTGAWTQALETGGNHNSSGPNIKFSPTAGAQSVFALPAWYNGQAVTISAVSPGGFALTMTVTDETSANRGSLTTTGVAPASPARNVPARVRIPAGTLAPGAHTLTTTYTAIGQNAFQDYIAVEATPPPLVVLQLANRLPDYTKHASGWAHAPITDADITTINTILTSVAAEYADGRVITVATDDIINDSTAELLVDGVHPDSQASGLIAARAFDLVAAFFLTHQADVAVLGTA